MSEFFLVFFFGCRQCHTADSEANMSRHTRNDIVLRMYAQICPTRTVHSTCTLLRAGSSQLGSCTLIATLEVLPQRTGQAGTGDK